MFLQTLRYLLIQDWEDADGRPHELRLLYGAPGRWLADGATLTIERAPTMFGPVSVRCQSRLSQGEVTVEIEAPPRAPAKTMLRIPLPSGWKVTSAWVAGRPFPVGANEAIDLSGQRGELNLRLKVQPVVP